jgi:hypothetical protein
VRHNLLVHSGHIGNTFGPNGFLKGFQSASLVVEVSKVVVHESDEADALVDLFDADGLPGDDLTEIDLAHFEQMGAAGRDGDGPNRGTDNRG